MRFRAPGYSGDECCNRACLFLSKDSFQSQRDSLQELVLRGMRRNIELLNPRWCLAGLAALRSLSIQNLGLTDLQWLDQGCDSELASLHSLDLDDNEVLQLSGASLTILSSMAGLRLLTGQTTLAEGNMSVA